MSDPKPPGPFYPPTTRLPKVEVPQGTLDAVLTEVRAMRSETNDRLDSLEGAVASLVNDKMTTNQRLNILDTRINDMDTRAASNSIRAKSTSEMDMRQDAAISMLITKVDRVETKTDAQTAMLTEAKDAAKRLWSNPAVKAGVSLLWGAILYWLGSKGIRVPQ